MGRSAKVGLFLLMGLVVALARLIEVEIGKPHAPSEGVPLAVLMAPPTPKRSPHPSLPHIVHHLHGATTPAPAAKSPVPVANATPPSKPATLPIDAQAEWPKGPVYTVRKGETPAAIAKKLLGSAKLWNKIYELNKSRLPNPNVVKQGTRLVVPARDASAPSSGAGAGKPTAAPVEKDEDD